MTIQTLQNKIGVKSDGVFGPATLTAAASHFKLSAAQAAHFFGQTAHETGGFRSFVENLNYSAKGLQTVFGRYFPTQEMANQYARQPQRIANLVYANRMGNGDSQSNDGWDYRGRGALQLTGRNNYARYSIWQKEPDILHNPDLVADQFAFESALWFFGVNGLWPMCRVVSDHTILSATRRINGGTNGLQCRTQYTRKYFEWLQARGVK